MPLPVIAGVMRCAVVGQTQGGDTWTNVWHARDKAGITPTPLTRIDELHAMLIRVYTGTAFASGAPWFNACATGVTLTRVDYTALDGMALGYSKAASGAGSSGTSTLPAQTSSVVTLRTAVRGRRTRGRIYLPACSAAGTVITADGKLGAAAVSATIAQIAGLIAALPAIQWELVVASYGKSLIKDPNDKYDKIESTWTPFATPVTNVTMDAVFDVQRRRKA